MDGFKEFFSSLKTKLYGKKNDKTRKITISIVFCLVILLILTVDLLPREMEFSLGQQSPTDIRAPETRTIVDEEATQAREDLALANVSPVYKEDREALSKAQENKDRIFYFLLEASEETSFNEAELFFSELNIELDNDQWDYLINLDDTDLASLRVALSTALEEIYRGAVYEDDLNNSKEELLEIIASEYEDDNFTLVEDIFTALLFPNIVIDQEATENKEAEILAGLEPVTITINSGELIVQEGQEIGSQELSFLEEFSISRGEISWFKITGVTFYFLILTLVIFYYLIYYQPEIWRENNQVFLLESLLIILFFIAFILNRFQIDVLAYLAPVAMVSILATVLINTAAAVAVTIYISLLLPILFTGDFLLAASYFIAGMAGIFSVAEVSQRSDLVKAGFNVSGTMALTIIVLNFLNPAQLLLDYLVLAGLGLANGILVAVLANGLLPYLENGFDLTSAVKLLELSNPSNPLLKRLLVEAPGTYHHSVLVGNLAETAADQIGADSLLARVGAYYHDIGKLKRPFFFSDNQFGDENPHNKIKPNLSSLIIKSHVKDGIELAEKHKLPQEIIDIIAQHQGTSLISYFYQQAKESETRSNISETDFRYEGPKPQSKEAALIMLADVCEAAVRSKNFNKSNHSRIESVVKGLIREKLIDNELDESNLTLQELNIIGDSFSRVLTGIYHQRVDYPDDLEEEVEEVKDQGNEVKDKNNDKQSNIQSKDGSGTEEND